MKYTKKITFLLLIILLVSSLTACSILVPQDVKTDFTKYHVLFEVDGADYAQVKMIRSDHTKIVMPSNPVKDGYDFLGWFYKGTNDPFTQKEFDELKESIKTSINSVTVEAKFGINKDLNHMIFKLDDGSEYVNYDFKSADANTYTMPIDPVKDGYTFLGWVNEITNEPFTAPDFDAAKTSILQTQEPIYIIGKFLIDVTKYHVIFKNEDDSIYLAINLNVPNVETVLLPVNPTKEGYGFAGWFYEGTNTPFTKTEFDALKGTIKTSKDSVTVVAKFIEGNYTITFDNGFDEGAYHTSFIDSSIEFTGIEMPIDPVHDPYEFVNWYEDKEYNKVFDPSVNPHKNMIVYAKWNTPTYTIKFDLDSCGEIPSIVAKYNSTITAPTLDPKPGFAFKRFYVKNGMDNVTFVFDKMPKNGATVYAEWVNTSTINYMFGDKLMYSVNDFPISNPLTVEVVEPGNVCYQPDYIFQGWYLDKACETTKIDTITIDITTTSLNIYGKYKNRSFLDNLAVFRDKGNSDSDPINLSTDDELVQLIDYVLTFDLKKANTKYFTLKTLASPYTEISLKNKINENFTKITSVNNGIGYSYSKDGMGPIGIYSSLDDSAIDIKTENPIRYTQVKTGLIPILDTKRDTSFDNFKYNEYPLYEDKISTSNQLFYILQYGYKPQCVTGSVAEDMLNKAKTILKDCVNDTMDNFDKVYAIYCWLVQNVDYDNKALIDEKSSGNPNYTNKCEAWHLEGVFNSHLAVCDGISKAMVVLCRLEGIPCIRIAGPGHAWNKVYLDVDGEKEGKPAWYSIDATWGDTALEGEGQSILNLDSFLHKDSDKFNKGVLYDCYNHKDIVANTDVDIYSEITFKFEGNEYDLHITNTSETLVLKKYLNSLGPGRKSICVDIDYLGFGLDFGTYNHIDIDKANKIYLIIIE